MMGYAGAPRSSVDAQMDMMKSHVIRPTVREPKSDTPQHTFLLAIPPTWTGEALCIDQPDYYDEAVGLKAGEAAKRCAGCPVIEQCLAAAQVEEHGLSASNRYTIRGGLSPKERAELAFAERACGRGHTGRWSKSKSGQKAPYCMECAAEDRRARHERLRTDPEYMERKRQSLREHRDRWVSCLECRESMRVRHFDRHLSKHEGVAA